MGISNCLTTCAKFLFSKPNSPQTKLETAALFTGLGYAGLKCGQEGISILKRKGSRQKNLMKSTIGMAIAAGSIFGIGGSIIAGAGMKILVDKC